MTSNYWITTQWPPYEGDGHDFNIELQYHHKDAGQRLEPDDSIFIYELRTGRVQKGVGLKRQTGRAGIIALVKAIDCFKETSGAECTIFCDGKEETKMYWKWIAKIKIVSESGFVPRDEVNEILGYSPKYTLRGFGEMGSGLKIITKSQFYKLLESFNSSEYEKYCKK